MWVGNLFRLISFNGGLKKSILEYVRTEALKEGTLVGRDCYGNRYYDNPFYFIGRDRWVNYAPRHGYDYDATLVDSDWFRWLHYMTDQLPQEECLPRYSWLLDHTPNLTGTPHAFFPYSTTKPKIIPWKPPKNPNKKAC